VGSRNSLSSHALALEQREFTRHRITLPSKLFLPAENANFDCEVVNLSFGGAGVYCDEPPPLQSFVVLFIEGFGRFESVTTRYVNGELGLQFVCQEPKRQRLLADIMLFVNRGFISSTPTRRHTRKSSEMSCYMVRPNGERIQCSALDFSLRGISLRTDVRPPVGELITLGRIYGLVVRHHDQGVAVRLLRLKDQKPDVD
jgi:hypothetical protein